MALSTFNVQVDLGIGGIQTGVSAEKVVPGTLQQLKNADISVPGRIQKRRAFDIPLANDVSSTNYDKVFSLFNSDKECFRIVDNVSMPSGTPYTGNWYTNLSNVQRRMQYGHRVLQKLTNPSNKSTIPTWNTVGAVPSPITTDVISGGLGIALNTFDASNAKIATTNNPLQATSGYMEYSGRKYSCFGLLCAPTGVAAERTIIFHVKDYDTNETAAKLVLPIGNYSGDIDVTPSYSQQYFFCSYYDNAAGTRFCRTFDASTGTFLSTTVTIFIAVTVGSTCVSTKTGYVVAYQGAAGTITVRRYSFNKASGGAGAAPAPDFTYNVALVGVFLTFPAINAYTDYGNQEHVGVFWSENRAGLHYLCGQMLDGVLAAVGATATLNIGFVATLPAQHTSAKPISIPYDTNAGGTISNSKGQSLAFYQYTDTADNTTRIAGMFFSESAGTITFEQVMSVKSVALLAVPFSFGNFLHGTANRYKNYSGGIDDNYFLVTRPSPSGQEDPSIYLMQFSFNPTASAPPYFTNGYVRCVAKIDRISNLTNTGNDQPWSSKVAVVGDVNETIIAPIGSPGVSFDFYKIANNSTALGDVVSDSYKDIMNGGFGLQINEDTCLEREPLSIEGTLTLTGSAGGALTPTGVYQVSIVKRIEYASGLVCRGAPTVPTSITLGGAQTKITIAIPTINQISNTATNQNNLSITYEVYRTTNGGTVFYLENSVSSEYPYLYATTLTATISDATIITRPILYTAGGVIENITAPNITSLTRYKGRIAASVGQSEPCLWVTKEQTNSSIGQFTDAFKVPIASKGYEVTVVRELDDKIIIFTEDSISFIYGEGPNDTGTTSSFGAPIKISENVGCVSNKAITRLDNRIIFRGREGFYFLTSKLTVEKASLPVQYFAALGTYEVTSTIQLDNRKQIQFYTSNGYRLVYFTETEQWTLDNIGASLAARYNDAVVVVKKTGTTYTDLEMHMENPSNLPSAWTYSDNIGGYYPLEIKTGWISFTGLQGLARVWRCILLGRAYTNCTIKVGFSYDYNPTVVDISDWVVDSTTTLVYTDDDLYLNLQPATSSTLPPLQKRIHMPRQKVEAVQITIWDTAQTGIGKSFELNQITFEVGLRQGIMKLSQAQSS